MPEQLQPNGNPIKVGSVTIRSPGLAGVANAYLPSAPGLRSVTRTTDELERALESAGLQTTETVEIAGAREVPAAARGVRSTAYDEPALEIEVPDPGEQWGQVVLYTDEAGVTQWSFARDASNAIEVTRGRGTRTYVISRRVTASPAAPGTRGLVGAIGKKVLRVLVFPMIDPVLGEVGDFFAARWEQAKRPYRLRGFEPGTQTAAEVPALGEGDWQRLATGPSLLLLHGTFSRAHTAFGGLPDSTLAELSRLYEGRVFAFDHYTLSDDPRENVARLLREMPDALNLELDIVSHSRGGLVGRVLAERQPELSLGSRQLRVRKLALVAAPNAGTKLADIDHWNSLIDTYTTVLNFFPDNGVTETVETIVTLVKQVAVGALKGLDGLTSMQPKGEFLTTLNQGGANQTRYYALASNYEPPETETGLKHYAKDIVFDRLFGTHNDLVVPTAGVWDKNGCDLFPIADRHVFEEADGVQHAGFFKNATAGQKLLEWLRT